MVRLQIQLEDSQHRALKRWANRLGISFSEAVRRCVAEQLARNEGSSGRSDRVHEARSIIGKYGSGRSDISERHDDFLAEGFGE